ncbi:hypothetical protein IW261DRAFT_1502900 [Armillaria novae-zelandiae]|uniref:Uncharacterized protein n=1 Tax=Armillaria novae-zelandiae TaxID=153914 RepID=A0AA39NXI2_9AGAR|nr:hypothetical protein IW261DRAFT_1502900 [Armillaria novae-zelandiae]
MQFSNTPGEDHFSMFEKYYSMDDAKLDLMYTNTELGDRVYVDYSSVIRDTPPELLYICKIVQAMMVLPIQDEYWYMLEHAVLSPRGELYLRYSVHESNGSVTEPPFLPAYADTLSIAQAYYKFRFPIDITNIAALELCAGTLQAVVTAGALSPLEAYLVPAAADTMVAVHAIGQANSRYLHLAHKTDLAAECVARGMWSLVEMVSDGKDMEDNMHREVACTAWYYRPGYGLVSGVETDEETKKTYYREIIRWFADDSDDSDDSEDEADE